MVSLLFFKSCLWFWREQTPRYFAVLQEKKNNQNPPQISCFFPHFRQGWCSVSSFHRVNNHHRGDGVQWQVPLPPAKPSTHSTPRTSFSLAWTLRGYGYPSLVVRPLARRPPASPHSSCSRGRKRPRRGGSRSASPRRSSPLPRRPTALLGTACTRLRVLLPRKLFTNLYAPNPHAALLRTMASTLEKFIHSLDPRALPRVLQIQSGIYFQGEHRVLSGRALQVCLWHQVPLGTGMWGRQREDVDRVVSQQFPTSCSFPFEEPE